MWVSDYCSEDHKKLHFLILWSKCLSDNVNSLLSSSVWLRCDSWQTISVGQLHKYPELQPFKALQVCENVSAVFLFLDIFHTIVCCLFLISLWWCFFSSVFETCLKVKSFLYLEFKLFPAAHLLSLTDVVFSVAWTGVFPQDEVEVVSSDEDDDDDNRRRRKKKKKKGLNKQSQEKTDKGSFL